MTAAVTTMTTMMLMTKKDCIRQKAPLEIRARNWIHTPRHICLARHQTRAWAAKENKLTDPFKWQIAPCCIFFLLYIVTYASGSKRALWRRGLAIWRRGTLGASDKFYFARRGEQAATWIFGLCAICTISTTCTRTQHVQGSMTHCAQGSEPLKRAIAPLLNQFNAIVGCRPAHSGHRSHGGERRIWMTIETAAMTTLLMIKLVIMFFNLETSNSILVQTSVDIYVVLGWNMEALAISIHILRSPSQFAASNCKM